jgi:hypothetical protein
MFEYDAKVDGRKRITLRRAEYQHYHVTVHPDGRIVLEPRVLSESPAISRRSLAAMDQAAAELEAGRVSDAVEPKELLLRKTKRAGTLAEFFAASPLRGSGLRVARRRGGPS